MSGENDLTADAEASIPIIIEEYKRILKADNISDTAEKIRLDTSANIRKHEKDLKPVSYTHLTLPTKA